MGDDDSYADMICEAEAYGCTEDGIHFGEDGEIIAIEPDKE